MNGHPWCTDIERDEAVRAAEDAVERPAVPDWREIPERVAALERKVAAMRVPVAADGEAAVERLKCDECSRSFSFEEFNGGTRRLVEPDNAFGPERWETLCPACVCKDALRERDAALARVAELEEQAKLAPDANGGAGSNQADAKPVAWAVVYPNGADGVISLRKADAEHIAADGDEVVPLFRSPPHPRGWLTAEEREAIKRVAFEVEVSTLSARPLRVDGADAATLRALLASNAPPKVRLPDYVCWVESNVRYYRMRELRDALAAAGVEVEE